MMEQEFVSVGGKLMAWVRGWEVNGWECAGLIRVRNLRIMIWG